MGRQSTIVRVSSKGQIVIPVAVRRRLGLKTGQPLAIRANTQDEIVLRPASGLRIHPPDEPIARRGAQLETSLADGFAAATAQELGARFHTTDGELVRLTHY